MKITLPDSPLDADRLAGLLFELASQLHAERARRIALEYQLEHAGVLPDGWDDQLQDNPELHQRSQVSLEFAMNKLIRVLTEHDDPRTPLRYETAAGNNQE